MGSDFRLLYIVTLVRLPRSVPTFKTILSHLTAETRNSDAENAAGTLLFTSQYFTRDIYVRVSQINEKRTLLASEDLHERKNQVNGPLDQAQRLHNKYIGR